MPRLFDRSVRADKARSREMGSPDWAGHVASHRGGAPWDSARRIAAGRTAFTVRLPGLAANPVAG